MSVTCACVCVRTAEMELPLVKLTIEPLNPSSLEIDRLSALSRFELVSNLESTVGKHTPFAYSLPTGATMQAKPSSRSFQLCYRCAEGKIDCVHRRSSAIALLGLP